MYEVFDKSAIVLNSHAWLLSGSYPSLLLSGDTILVVVLSAKAFGVVMVINYPAGFTWVLSQLLVGQPFWYAMLIAKGRQCCSPRDNTELCVVRGPV